METSVCDDGSNFQQLLLDRFAERVRKQVGSLLNRVLELEQMLHLGCCPYERTTTRRGHRNGYDARWLETRWGPVRLRVPKVRGTQEPFRPRALVRYGRREAALGKAIELWAASGMSTRKVARAVHETFGCLLSATAVSRILARVDEEVAAFHRRRWSRGYRYLYLDGKHGSVLQKGRRGLRKRPGTLLVAWGIDHGGNREVVDFRVARGEDAASWTAFLTDLERRGVRGENRWAEQLEMIVTDGAGGIESALDTVYPGVPRQLCVFHKVQAIASHLRDRSNRAEILKGAARIYWGAGSAPQARARYRRWAQRWQEIEPEAVACFRADFDETLHYLTAPPTYRRALKTNNPIERLIEELERKFASVSVFANEQSWERITFLVWKHLKLAGHPKSPKSHFTRKS